MSVVSLSLFSFGNFASASSYTYEFDITWNPGAGVTWGTGGAVDFTVNNGNSTNVNQTYNLSQITQVSVTSIGGTASLTFNIPSDPLTNTQNTTNLNLFIQSNGTGNQATLNFNQISDTWTANNQSYLVTYAPNSGWSTLLQLATDPYTNIFVEYWDTNHYETAFYTNMLRANGNTLLGVPTTCPNYVGNWCPVSLSGNIVNANSTPIPAAIWLSGSALVWLGLIGSRRKG